MEESFDNEIITSLKMRNNQYVQYKLIVFFVRAYRKLTYYALFSLIKNVCG